MLSRVGRDLYEKMFRGYTRKQWGLDPSQLDAQVTARIPVRTNRDDRYFTDTHQAMPLRGFTHMFENMLDHPLIHLELGVDYREVAKRVSYREMIYSGAIDDFFDYRFGKLPYRSLEFRHETVKQRQFQPVAVVITRRTRVYAHHRVQASHRPDTRRDERCVRVPPRRGRPLLSRSPARECRPLPEV